MLGIVLKGINGVVETVAGIVFLLVPRSALKWFLLLITQRELAEDPADRFSHFLLSWAFGLQLSTKLFIASYLIIHGLVKIFLVVNLLREKKWIFPVALTVLGMLVALQSARLIVHFTPLLLVFTAIDTAVIAFIWNEYAVVRKSLRENAKTADLDMGV